MDFASTGGFDDAPKTVLRRAPQPSDESNAVWDGPQEQDRSALRSLLSQRLERQATRQLHQLLGQRFKLFH
jgi:hypothetical protein